MKPLPTIILLICCAWAAGAHASCFTPLGSDTTSTCGTQPPSSCYVIHQQGGVCLHDGVTGAILPQAVYQSAAPFIVPTFSTGNCDWGDTNASVDANFARCIEYNFTHNPNLETVVQGMPPLVLARFSDEMQKYDVSGYTLQMLITVAQRLSGQSMAKVASAFGASSVALSYASSTNRAIYNSINIVPVVGSAYWQSVHHQAQTWPSKGADTPAHLFLLAYTSGPGKTEYTSAGAVEPVKAAFNKAWRYQSIHMSKQNMPGNPYPSTEFPWFEVAKGVGDMLDIIYKNYLWNSTHNLPPLTQTQQICIANTGCLFIDPTAINTSGVTVEFAPPPIIDVPPQPFVPNPPPYLQYVDANGNSYTNTCFVNDVAVLASGSEDYIWNCPI